tara:strand:+ start:422 stop:1681 length:1260 start_codon:yes stop_codon:yes gene_type:complete
MSKLSLHVKILLGMLFGVIVGIVAVNLNFNQFITDWIKPFGTIFINLLKLIAVPIVFVSLIKGISSLNDIAKLSKIGFRSILLYLSSTFLAVTIGLILVNVINPGETLSNSLSADFFQSQSSQSIVLEKSKIAEEVKNQSPLQFLVDIVPSNIFLSATDNSKMLQVIFFSILFGISLVVLPKDKVTYVKGFFDGLNEVVLKMVEFIMDYSPYGVFALIAGLIVEFGASSSLFVGLTYYSLTVVLGLLIMIFFVYPMFLKIFTKTDIVGFFKGILPAQMLAFSTSSSAATLPVTIDCCEKNLGVKKEVSSFVLPLGATINMDGTSMYQAIAAVFIAQVLGMDLDISQQLTIVLTATLASIGSAAVPGAGMVMLVIVLSSIGIGADKIALIFAVDRLLDMIRTVVNVTGDSAIAKIIDSLK